MGGGGGKYFLAVVTVFVTIKQSSYTVFSIKMAFAQFLRLPEASVTIS